MPAKFEHILIVDDDLSLVPLWQIIVARHSKTAKMEWAVSSEEARRLIREATSQAQSFDLIVADLFLAGSDTGVEFLSCPEVRALDAKTVLTSSADPEKLKSHCQLTLPETAVVAKPLNVVKCERTLEALAG